MVYLMERQGWSDLLVSVHNSRPHAYRPQPESKSSAQVVVKLEVMNVLPYARTAPSCYYSAFSSQRYFGPDSALCENPLYMRGTEVSASGAM